MCSDKDFTFLYKTNDLLLKHLYYLRNGGLSATKYQSKDRVHHQAEDSSIGMGVHLLQEVKQRQYHRDKGPFASGYQAKDSSIEMGVNLLVPLEFNKLN